MSEPFKPLKDAPISIDIDNLPVPVIENPPFMVDPNKHERE